MNKIITFVILQLIALQLFSQNVKMDTVIYYNLNKDTTIYKYNVYEDLPIITFECLKSKGWINVYSYYTTIGGVKYDSTYVVTSLPVLYEGTAFFKNGFAKNYEPNHNTIYITKEKKIGKCESDYYQSSCSLIAFRGDSTRLSLVNPLTNELSPVYNFSNNDYAGNKKEYIPREVYDDLEIYNDNTFFISPDVCLVEISDGDPNGYCYRQLINKGQHVRYMTVYRQFYIGHIFDKNNMVLVDDDMEYSIQIRDYALDIVNDILGHRDAKYGVNVLNGKIQCYYLMSRLDDADYVARPIRYGTPVIIPYKFNPQLEIQMYRAYNDSVLTETDIVGLGKYELGILRNLLFAKHNYKFKSEFYQAYFNMYGFYQEKEKSTTRKSNVDSLLTASDKANIALIRRMEANLK